MRVITGTYAGNGDAGHAITGLPFPPDVVIIKGSIGQPSVARTATMVGDATKELGTNVAVRSGLITSLDATGFTVGSDARVNGSSTTYYWIAFKSSPGEMVIGSYTGDGNDDRSITGIGFSPAYAIVMSEAGDLAMQRFATEDVDKSFEFKNSGEKADRIQDFEADGFQVGKHSTVNEAGVIFHYIAWNDVPGRVADSTYVGDGLDNRDITGLGFEPQLVIIKSRESETGVLRSDVQPVDNAFLISGGTPVADHIQTMLPDGFQVGTAKPVNDHDKQIFCVAFRGLTEGVELSTAKSASETAAQVGDTVSYKVAVTNGGYETASSITVRDVLPGGLTWLSDSTGTGVYNHLSGDWTISSLPVASSASLYITARVESAAAGSTIVNTAYVSAVDQTELDPSNDTASVAITVNARPNLLPIGNQSVLEGAKLTVAITATDDDPNTLALTAQNLPANATFADSGKGHGAFVFTPDYTQAGAYTVTFIASDGNLADTESVNITVEDVNQAPILATITDKFVNFGSTLNFVVSATDPDGTTPILTAQSVPANATFVDNGDGTGQFTFNPSILQIGVHNVRFIASDGVLADSQSVAITVLLANLPPTLDPIGSQTVDEGSLLSVVVTASDPNLTIPALLAENLPANATFTDNADGSGLFEFTPGYSQAGVYNVRFIASDGEFADTEVVEITVNNTNQSPIITPVGAQSVAEGDSLSLTITATDPDGTTPALAAENVPLHAGFTDQADGTGRFGFRPDYAQAGAYAVRVIATDGLLSDTLTVTITVTETDRRPVWTPIANQSTAENVLLTFGVNASDPDSTVPVLTLANAPSGATLTDHADGTGEFSFTPDYSQAGIYNILFLASDGVLTDTETVAITVTNVNRAPVLNPISDKVVGAGQDVEVAVAATDPDGTFPLLSAQDVPANASFADHADGTGLFTFMPDGTQIGDHDLMFIASDGEFADTAIVRFTVTFTNFPPELDSIGEQSVTEGQVLTFDVTASDPEGTFPVLTASGLPTNASFSDHNDGSGTFQFAPGYTQAGVYEVLFVASDGALTDSEYVGITVIEAGNQPPTLSVIGETSVTVGATLHLDLTATDPENESIALFDVNPPQGAVLIDEGIGTGTFDFTPTETQAGDHNVLFIASDGALSDTVPVTLTVIPSDLSLLVVTPDTASFLVGGSAGFQAKGFTSLYQQTDPGNVSWSVIGGIGAIGNNGVFVATARGVGRIVATSTSTGVADTSGAVVVDVLYAEDVPLGDRYVRVGGSATPLLAFKVQNRFDTPRGIDAIQVRDASSGAGTPSQVLSNFGGVSVYVDANANGQFDLTDQVLANGVMSDSAVLEFTTTTILPYSTRTFFVTHTLGARPHDGDSLDLTLMPERDLRTDDGSPVGGATSLNSLGMSIVDGMVAAQLKLTATGTSELDAAQGLQLAAIVDVPRNGYAVDTLSILSLRNFGTALVSDFDSLVCYADNGNGTWNGPGVDTRIGVMKFTGGLWTVSGLKRTLAAAANRLFVAADVSQFATNGATVALGIPYHGIEVASGNDGPIDTDVPAVETLSITASPGIIADVIPVTAINVVPFVRSGVVGAVRLVNGQVDAAHLTTLHCRAAVVDPDGATQQELDSQVDTIFVWLDRDEDPTTIDEHDSLLAFAPVIDGQASVAVGDVALTAGGGQASLSFNVVLNPTAAKNGNLVGVSIDSPADLGWTVASPVIGDFPLVNPNLSQIVTFPAAGIALNDSGGTTFYGGDQSGLAFDISLPRNGYDADVLTSMRLANRGTLDDGSAISAVKLWADPNDNGLTGDEFSVGTFVYTGSGWILGNLNVPLAHPHNRFLITVDITNGQFDGGTLQFEIPVKGCTYASLTDGPDDVPFVLPVPHLVFPSDRMTVISIPEAARVVRPGTPSAAILTFALYNGYRDESKTLNAVTLRNTSRTALGTPCPDGHVGQVQFLWDNNGDRILNDDALLGTGYLNNSRLRLSGLNVTLGPEQLSYFFAVTDVPLGVSDADTLKLSIDDFADFEFATSVIINGDIPIVGAGTLIVDGSVRDQYASIEQTASILRAGFADVPVWSFRPARNGGIADTLTHVTLTNLGTADTSVLADMTLWQDTDGDGAWSAADANLGALQFANGIWILDDLTLAVNSPAPLLHVTADIREDAPSDASVRLSIPVNGCQFTSANDGPLDYPLTAGKTRFISQSSLAASGLPLRPTYSVGQTIPVGVRLTNLSATDFDSLAASTSILTGDAFVQLDSITGLVPTLAATDSTDVVFHYTALQEGSVQWRLRGIAPLVHDSSVIVETAPVAIQSPPSPAIVELVSSMPSSVNRGQENIFPMTLLIEHPDQQFATTAPFRLDSLVLTMEDQDGAPLAFSDIIQGLTLSSERQSLTVLDVIPDGDAAVLIFSEPVVILPGTVRRFSVLLDIADEAVTGSFRLVLSDGASVPLTDVNTGESIAFNTGVHFPLATSLCRVADPAQQLAVSAENLIAGAVNLGQHNAGILRLGLRHSGDASSSLIQLTRVDCEFTDAYGASVSPAVLFQSVRLVHNGFVIGEVIPAPAHQQLTIPLGAPVTLSPGQTESVDLQATLRQSIPVDNFRAVIADSTKFFVRDLSSGATLPTVTDQLVSTDGSAFPIKSFVAQIRRPAEPLDLCVASQLPATVISGTHGISMMTLQLRNAQEESYSPVLLQSVKFDVLDTLGRVLDATALFDRLGYKVDGGVVQYLPDIRLESGMVRIIFGDDGIVCAAGTEHDVTIVANLEADAPYGHFLIELESAATVSTVDATDQNRTLATTADAGCPDLWPFRAGPASVILPAGRPTLTVANDGTQLVHVGQTGVVALTASLDYQSQTQQGSVVLETLRGRLVPSLEMAGSIQVADVFDSLWLRIGDQIQPASYVLDNDEVVFQLAPAAVIPNGAISTLSVAGTVSADAPLGTYQFEVSDSTGVVLYDDQLATQVFAVAGESYPMQGQPLSIVESDLSSSFTNYPNPFNPSVEELTTIGFTLEQDATVDLDVYTITGSLVRTLLSKASRGAGSHSEDQWDGRNDDGRFVTPGTYFCRIRASYTDGRKQTYRRKIAVIR